MDALQGFSKIPYVHALIIIVITLITAKVVDIFIDRVLLRLAQKTRIEADDLIVSIIHKPTCGTVRLYLIWNF